MATFHVKKGDEVVVIAGAERGKRGRIIQVLPGKRRVIVEGIKLVTRHLRKSQQHPEGTIAKREAAIDVSNVMAATRYDARAAKRSATVPA